MSGEFIFTFELCRGTPEVVRFESEGELWSYAVGWCRGGLGAVVAMTDKHLNGVTL